MDFQKEYAEFGLKATLAGWAVTDYDNETITWEKGDNCFVVVFKGEYQNSQFGIISIFGDIDF